MDLPRIELGAVNLEAQDPRTLAVFWAAVTGGTPSTGGESVFLPAAGRSGFAMFFQPMTGPRPDRGTVHLDLTVPRRRGDRGLGARPRGCRRPWP